MSMLLCSEVSDSLSVQGADKRDGPNYFVMVNDFRGMAALLRKLEDKIKQLADSAPRYPAFPEVEERG